MRPYTQNIPVPDIGTTRTERRVQFIHTRGAVVLVRFKLWPLLVNTDIVVVGGPQCYATFDTDADDAQGLVLWPNDREGTPWFFDPEGLDMADWFVDARVANDGIRLFGFLKG